MFWDKFKDLSKLAQLSQDENFRKFLANPKVQELMLDEEFKKAVQQKNMMKLVSNAKFSELMRDPEIRTSLEAFGKGLK